MNFIKNRHHFVVFENNTLIHLYYLCDANRKISNQKQIFPSYSILKIQYTTASQLTKCFSFIYPSALVNKYCMNKNHHSFTEPFSFLMNMKICIGEKAKILQTLILFFLVYSLREISHQLKLPFHYFFHPPIYLLHFSIFVEFDNANFSLPCSNFKSAYLVCR